MKNEQVVIYKKPKNKERKQMKHTDELLTNILTEAIKTGLATLSNKSVGTYTGTDAQGLHYSFGEDEFVISIKRVDEGKELKVVELTSATSELEVAVTDALRNIGIPANILGYYYLKEAIILVIDDPHMLGAITKWLYPTVAKKHKTTPSRVERAIRHAIERAWRKGNVEYLDKMFGYTVDTMKGKPTNSEFIALVSDNIRLNKVK